MSVYDLLRQCRSGRSSSSGSSSPGIVDPDTSRVKRALFGPVDHEENSRFLKQELARGRREASERWNFDFENDRPKEGRFEWQKIDLPNNPGKNKVVGQDCDSSALTPSDPNAPTTQNTVRRKSLADSSSNKDTPNISVQQDESRSGALKTTTSITSDESSSSGNSSGKQQDASSSRTGARPKSSQRQSSITDHFNSRKRSKSKVKVQERRQNSPPSQPTATLFTQTKPSEEK